jgi:glycosyltransferase involved in cell wall biosynthesis
MNYSVIIPFFNEEKNVESVLNDLLKSLKSLSGTKRNFEIILVDDCSKDDTLHKLKLFSSSDFKTLIIKHKTNQSQSSAILTGINHSNYENIITLDGDGQNNPNDIINLISKFENGIDMVIGWRKKRKDDYFKKILPSIIANYFVRLFTKSKIHDHGCALKVFKKDKIDDLTNWGDFHRLLAARFASNNYLVEEVVVEHRHRIYGISNYGFNRVAYVILDLLYIKLFKNYKTKSIYIFGIFSLVSFLFSISVFTLMIILKFLYNYSFISTPLPILAVFLFMSGTMFLFIGFVSQLIISQNENVRKADNQDTIERIEIS